MPYRVEKTKGGYHVRHTAPAGRTDVMPGPVYRRPHKDKQADFVYLQYGMGSGPWIIMVRDYQTGKARRLQGSAFWETREEAVEAITYRAKAFEWHEVTEAGRPDFVD